MGSGVSVASSGPPQTITKRSEDQDWLIHQPLVIAAIALVGFSTVVAVVYCICRRKRSGDSNEKTQLLDTNEGDGRRPLSCSPSYPCARCCGLYIQNKHRHSIMKQLEVGGE